MCVCGCRGGRAGDGVERVDFVDRICLCDIGHWAWVGKGGGEGTRNKRGGVQGTGGDIAVEGGEGWGLTVGQEEMKKKFRGKRQDALIGDRLKMSIFRISSKYIQIHNGTVT